MSEMAKIKINPAGGAIVAAVTGGVAALGAAMSDRHPGVGAAVGVGTANAILAGLLVASSPLEPKPGELSALAAAMLFGTALVGGGAALGTVVADKRPALGAFVGAATVSTLGMILQNMRSIPTLEEQKATNALSGAPRVLRLVREGTFL